MGAKPAVQVATCWGEPQEKKRRAGAKRSAFFFLVGGNAPPVWRSGARPPGLTGPSVSWDGTVIDWGSDS